VAIYYVLRLAIHALFISNIYIKCLLAKLQIKLAVTNIVYNYLIKKWAKSIHHEMQFAVYNKNLPMVGAGYTDISTTYILIMVSSK
jgi:hypothetical protein